MGGGPGPPPPPPPPAGGGCAVAWGVLLPHSAATEMTAPLKKLRIILEHTNAALNSSARACSCQFARPFFLFSFQICPSRTIAHRVPLRLMAPHPLISLECAMETATWSSTFRDRVFVTHSAPGGNPASRGATLLIDATYSGPAIDEDQAQLIDPTEAEAAFRGVLRGHVDGKDFSGAGSPGREARTVEDIAADVWRFLASATPPPGNHAARHLAITAACSDVVAVRFKAPLLVPRGNAL